MFEELAWDVDTLAPLLDGWATPVLQRLVLWPHRDNVDHPLVEALLDRVRTAPIGRTTTVDIGFIGAIDDTDAYDDG